VIDPKYIKKLGDKEFVMYAGLLNEAHLIGLSSLTTELVKLEKTETGILVVFKAVATGKNGECFHGYGDATDKNVSKMVLPHIIRMAETRAKARALRDYTNIGMCSVEELGE
jgi:hypothetical protein